MLSKVAGYIDKQQLLDRNSRYIVGLSGGADSVALAIVLQELGFCIEAAHCNFHLRGEESDRDEAFVARLCCERNIPLHKAHFDTLAYSELHKVSIEMAARKLRYSYFNQLAADVDAGAICVGHHVEDSVETVLINLLRGTGIHGMVGIRPVSGNIIRPLLCVTRGEIEDFLRELGQDYVTDSSNLVPDVVRNNIRLNVIPQLVGINAGALGNLRRTMDNLLEAERIYNSSIGELIRNAVVEKGDGCVCAKKALLDYPSPRSAIHEIVQRYGFSSEQAAMIEKSLKGQPGRVFSSADYDLLVDRKDIIIERKGVPVKALKIPETGIYNAAHGRIELKVVERREVKEISKEAALAYIDASKAAFPLVLRTCQPGDCFVPFGMNGKKLVSDYMTDRKKTIFEKRRQLVLTDADGNIVWLVGERIDNRVRIDEGTDRIILVRFEGLSGI